MAFFVIRCVDVEGSAELRAQHREAHLGHVRGSGKSRIAGPLLDEAEAVRGSLLIIEAADLADAQAFSDIDPYRHAGVWSSVEITPFRMTYVDLSPAPEAEAKP
jgi:uncharacterized protein YciI